MAVADGGSAGASTGLGGRAPGGRTGAEGRGSSGAGTRGVGGGRDSGSRGSVLPEIDRFNVRQLTPYVAPAKEKAPAEPEFIGPSAPGARAGRPTFSLPTRESKPAEPKTVAPPEAPKKKSYEMSWEDYEALTERQRAAVDYNTMLVRAREKDLNAKRKPTPQQRENYDEAVRDIFGPDGGSEVYAPETLAVLREIDFTVDADATKGNDLDDFLGLKTLIREKDLAKIEVAMPAPVAAPTPLHNLMTTDSGADSRAELLGTVTTQTAQLQEAMGRGAQLLQNFQQWTQSRMNDDRALFGAPAKQVRLKNEMTGSSMEQFFQTAMTQLASRTEDPARVWSVVDQVLVKPGEKAAFKKYVDMNLETPEYNVAVTANDWRTPEEYRQLLKNLDKGGD